MSVDTQQDIWREERLYCDAKPYFEALLWDINNACEEIILETYIFSLDDTGKQVLEALQRAAQRHVRIKLLMDGIGSGETAERIALQLDFPKTEVRIYHPLPWNFSAYRWAMRHRSWPIKFWRFLTEVNHRDHRKLCIIDEKIAWLGSFNITDGFVEGHPVGRHETAARLAGSPVASLKNNFFHVWQQKTRTSRHRLRSYLSNNSLKYRKRKNAELVRIISEAKRRVWITNAYFSPSNALIKTLKHAVKRGVNVSVIVPSRSDMHFFPALTRTFYADLIGAGLNIYEYGEKILHSKTILIDDQLIVGSTNLNFRSYFHDLELDAILSQPETVRLMEKKFIADKNSSDEVTLHRMQHYPKLLKIIGWLSRFFRYWL